MKNFSKAILIPFSNKKWFYFDLTLLPAPEVGVFEMSIDRTTYLKGIILSLCFYRLLFVCIHLYSEPITVSWPYGTSI